MSMPILRTAILSALAALLVAVSFAASPLPQASPPPDARGASARAAGSLRVELGIDSLERRFYRPAFSFDWPLAGEGRFFAGLGFWQRMNGRLEGDIDYWLEGGFEDRVSESLSLEGRLGHLCRHLTSLDNPLILNVNELTGRLWLTAGGARLGAGFGTYLGGSPGYRHLLIAAARLAGFPGPEFGLEGELKWVNLREVLYEVELNASLSPGAAIFARAARHYGLPPTAYLGVRFGPGGDGPLYRDAFWISAGAYPVFGLHKLVASGGYRLGIMEREGRRFYADIEFDAPILAGTRFLGTYWPDRMLYWISNTYAFDFGDGLQAGIYGRYALDMPADRAEPFRGRLAAGVAFMNQPLFERLDKPVRFEVRAGYDFKADFDLEVRLGLNTAGTRAVRIGGEARFQATGLSAWGEVRAFADIGRSGRISVRPFFGFRKIGTLAGDSLPRESLVRKLAVGLALYKWI